MQDEASSILAHRTVATHADVAQLAEAARPERVWSEGSTPSDGTACTVCFWRGGGSLKSARRVRSPHSARAESWSGDSARPKPARTSFDSTSAHEANRLQRVVFNSSTRGPGPRSAGAIPAPLTGETHEEEKEETKVR